MLHSLGFIIFCHLCTLDNKVHCAFLLKSDSSHVWLFCWFCGCSGQSGEAEPFVSPTTTIFVSHPYLVKFNKLSLNHDFVMNSTRWPMNELKFMEILLNLLWILSFSQIIFVLAAVCIIEIQPCFLDCQILFCRDQTFHTSKAQHSL
jgi:hypothetical protein